MLPFSIANFDADCIFLAVLSLSAPFILSDDWLSKYNIILDYQINMVKFPCWELQCPFQAPVKTNNSVALSFLYVRESYEPVYRSSLD